GTNLVFVILELVEFLAGCQAPQANGFVGAAGGDRLTVGCDRETNHLGLMALELAKELAGLDVPQTQEMGFVFAVAGAGEERLAIRRERQVEKRVAVAGATVAIQLETAEGTNLLPRRGIPDADAVIAEDRASTARGEELAIGREHRGQQVVGAV